MRERQIEVEEVNFAKSPLDEGAVRAIVRAAGGVAHVLNTRHATAKAEGWAEKPPTAAAFAKAAAAEPNLLRRPILLAGDRILVGYDKKNQDAWAAL